MTVKIESKRKRGTGVYLNRITEDSDYNDYDDQGEDPEVSNNGELVGAALRNIFYSLDLFDYGADIQIDYAHGCANMYLPQGLGRKKKEALFAELDNQDLYYSLFSDDDPNFFVVS